MAIFRRSGRTRPAQRRRDGQDRWEDVGGSSLGPYGIVAMGVLLVLEGALAAYALIALWPTAPGRELVLPAPTTTTRAAATTTSRAATATARPVAAQTTATTSTTSTTLIARFPPSSRDVSLFGRNLGLEREAQYFWVVALGGALGAVIHAIRSLAWHVGNRSAKRSWALWQATLPVVGAALALAVYLVVRGGLVIITGEASADTSTPFSFAAVAVLTGLFSEQASLQLKRLFESLLVRAEKGRDPAAEAPAGAAVAPSGLPYDEDDPPYERMAYEGPVQVEVGDGLAMEMTCFKDGDRSELLRITASAQPPPGTDPAETRGRLRDELQAIMANGCYFETIPVPAGGAQGELAELLTDTQDEGPLDLEDDPAFLTDDTTTDFDMELDTPDGAPQDGDTPEAVAVTIDPLIGTGLHRYRPRRARRASARIVVVRGRARLRLERRNSAGRLVAAKRTPSIGGGAISRRITLGRVDFPRSTFVALVRGLRPRTSYHITTVWRWRGYR